MWEDIACIVFVSVTANHLGLIDSIEIIVKRKLIIVNCPKCLSYWLVLSYMVFHTEDIITSLAVSFLASYCAIWLELLEGIIDTFYNYVYGKIYSADNKAAEQ